MPFKALLIDFDGVLRRWIRPVTPVEIEFGLPVGEIASIAFSPDRLVPAITGANTDATWRTGVAEELARRHDGCAALAAVARWSESPGELDQKTLSLLRRCRSDLRLVLVTNATSRLSDDLRALDLSDFFDAVVNSSEVRVAKPSTAFYRIALERAGATPAETLFIDDSAANVSAASVLGIPSHLFVSHHAMADFLRLHSVLNDSHA